MICLIKKYQDAFLNGIRNGSINPDKLVSMSTPEREAYLAQFVGEFNAKYVNTEFEAKLLLKNQKQGMISWAKKLSGISESTRSDILDKIGKLDKALDTKTDQSFLADIVERRLGVAVTKAEADEITRHANIIESLRDPNVKNEWQQSREYWQAKQALMKYMRSITPESIPRNMYQSIKAKAADVISVARSIKVGFNFHSPFRQGRALFGTKEWNRAFVNMFSYAASPAKFDGLEVDMMTNKYSDLLLKYKNDLGLTMLGATFTSREEDFASKINDSIPLLRASERGFVGFLNDLRFRRFTNILDQLEASGNGITDNPEAMRSLAQVIGASTGRGNLGGLEGAARSLSTALFSPRFLASRIRMIIDPITRMGPARIEAVKSLARLAGTSVAVLGVMKLAGLNVETDPRSSNFGTVRVGNTSFDMTGGMKTYIVMMAQVLENSTKSAATGKISQLNTGKFGSRTELDVLTSFMENKTSPIAGAIKEILQGQTFGGQKLSWKGLFTDKSEELYLADQLLNPLSSQEAIDAFGQAAGQHSFALGAAAFTGSFFGVTSQTFAPTVKKSSSRRGRPSSGRSLVR